MRTLITLAELVVLAALGVGAGFAANNIRDDEGIVVDHDYFPRQKPRLNNSSSVESNGGAPDVGPASGGDSPSGNPGPQTTATNGESAETAPNEHTVYQQEHEFQTITLEELKELLDDPATAECLNVVIDVRDSEQYEAGHIPGALQCDRYQPGKFIPIIRPYVDMAKKIIIYCNGGNCEDSLLMCRDLEWDFDVYRDRLYLYEGGWTEWTARGMSIERGPFHLLETEGGGQ